MSSHGRGVSVVGLGYVGLPVAVAFGRGARVVGFDVNPRLAALCAPPPLVLDVKGAFDRAGCAAAGIRRWRL